MKHEPKILVLDIETSFKIAAVWGRFKQYINMNQIIQDTYVLNWSAKWLDSEYTYSDALYYHKLYKKDPTDDSIIIQSIWEMMDEADYIITHNGDGFDIPILNAKFIQHGLTPPSNYRSIDTLKIARYNFKFSSNKLDDLAKMFGIRAKHKTDFDLWKKVCLQLDKKAFDYMVEYCETDVLILEKLYHFLAPWSNRHPATVLQTDLEKPRCNVCRSDKVIRNGSWATNTQIYQKWKCMAVNPTTGKKCGHNMRSRKADKLTKEEKANILRSI